MQRFAAICRCVCLILTSARSACSMLWVALNTEYFRSASQCLNALPADFGGVRIGKRSAAETEPRVSNRRVHADHLFCSAAKNSPHLTVRLSPEVLGHS